MLTNFNKLYFQSKRDWISLVISSLTNPFFRSVFFSFQILEIFSYVIDFNFTLYGREYNLPDLNPFKFIETCGMAQNTVCIGECSMCTWKESE